MVKLLCSVLLWLSFLTVYAQNTLSTLTLDKSIKNSELRKNFMNPPSESRLRCYWWWLNSMATRESITRDLEQMKAKGYGGASLVDAGSSNYQVARKTAAGPVFMSPEWLELYKHAVREAERIGIELSVNIQSGWNPGGPSITPEYALKKIVWTETNVTGGKEIDIELPQPEKKLLYRDIMVQAVKKPSGKNPLKDDVIKYWSEKSFNEKIGWKGIYPLNHLREDYTDSVPFTVIKKEEIIDLTENFKNNRVQWNAPDGEWTIIRYGYTCTGATTSTSSDGWSGLSVDHLSPAAFGLFSNTVITPLIKTAQAAGNSVKWLQTDSWEMDLVNWTDDFPAQFKNYRGYDIKNYMPVLTGRVVENREVSDRFLHDFRKTIGNSIRDNHYQLFYNLAHQYGMGIHPESGGPHSAPVDALDVMSVSDFPQGEFWAMANTHRIKDAERLSVRQSASVAHTNGKRFVAAEGPTSIGPQWERSPKDLKSNIDRVFCSGVNRIVWHTFTSSPKEFGLPGNEYFAGTHLNPNVTWWNKAGDFISYLNRCSYLLQQGLFVADVLYYYGDDVPNFVFLKEEFPELKFGYDWDKCSREVMLKRISFDGKKIVLPDGMSYNVLVLTPEKAIDPAVLKKVEALVNQGLTVISPRPEKATGLTNFPESDREVADIAARLWGPIDGVQITENKVGKGRVIWGRDINEVLAEMNVSPDFGFVSKRKNTSLDFIHRSSEHADIYFVTNRFSRNDFNDFEYRYIPGLPDRYEQVECKFRVTGKFPELWDPITGTISKILTYREENGYTILPLHFEPDGSKFIVFSDSAAQPHITRILKDGQPFFPSNQFETRNHPYINVSQVEKNAQAIIFENGEYALTWSDGYTEMLREQNNKKEWILTGKWDVHFDPAWGGPGKVQIDSLKSWTSFDDQRIKYYSGTAVYNKAFSVTSSALNGYQVILDLGNVQEMASVKINGHNLAVRWSAPFRFDITSWIKPGDNNLEVEVVNLWPNRLIGDGKLPEDKRLTKTNINKFNADDSGKYLRVSGLMGPVKIQWVKRVSLRQKQIR